MKKNKFITSAFKKTLLIVLASVFIPTFIVAQERDLEYYLSQIPFEMPRVIVPEFQDLSFNITAYGAVGNGKTMNTEAFARAIEACTAAGGGKIVVPPGLWLTGPIELKSNINLHVERGALIKFTSDRSEYPMVKPSARSSRYVTASPIYGYELKNIAITGSGIIDGAGESWRPVKKSKTTENQWKDLVKSGGVVSDDGEIWWPSKEAIDGNDYLKKMKKDIKNPGPEDFLPARDFLRPYMVYLVGCENVLIEDITLRNSPKFVVYPNNCTNITIRNTNVYNEWWSQNGDGIDISASKNVIIYKCNINVGDDGICMKSSGDGPESGTFAVENILVAGCNVYHAHGGFVIGSNTNGNVRNIFVTDCNFVGTDIGIRMKSTAGNGGIVEDIYIRDIYMTGIRDAAISFDTFYQNVPAGAIRDTSNKIVEHDVPVFRDFNISNVYCRGANKSIYMAGLPNSPIQDIYLNNVWIMAENGAEMTNVKGISLNNVRTDIREGPVYFFTGANTISINKGFMPLTSKIFIKASGAETTGITVTDTKLPENPETIQISDGAKKTAIKIN
ncbi:MAG: glycoside hydrolase family 28 protein [Bacteroidales bacterium]|nr:glycoside hydrolase family 28 protein [Bacteroidales bacterium]